MTIPKVALPVVRRGAPFSQQRIADHLFSTRTMFDVLRTLQDEVFVGDDESIRTARAAIGAMQESLTLKLGELREMELIDEARKRATR